MKRISPVLLLIFLAAINAVGAQQPSPSSKKPDAPAANQTSQQQPTGQTRTASKRERTITGRILDESNQPIQDATVLVLPAGLVNMPQTAALAAKFRPVSTDEQGKFSAENLSPGAYKLIPLVPGYVPTKDASHDLEHKYYLTGESVTLRMIKGGVITGTVTNESTEPVVGVRVRAIPVRDLLGQRTQADVMDAQQEWKTDDRGVYRIYGLDPGVYVVSAGGRGLLPFAVGAYDNDAPTFHPSSARVTALEVTVHSGEEMGGVDIRYRNSQGHAISGNVTSAGSAGSAQGFTVTTVVLTDAVSNALLGFAIAPMSSGSHPFAFDGVPDGNYFISAVGTDYSSGASSPRITVKGGDVTGIDILMVPFSSIEGRVTLEPAPAANRKPECQDGRVSTIEEVVVLTRQHETGQAKQRSSAISSLFPFDMDSIPNDKGEFKAGVLEPARYHVEARLPSEKWFVKSITLPPDKPAGPPKDAARDGLQLKPGEQVKALTVTIAENAAKFGGRVVPATQGARLPDGLHAHLIPAEKESAEDVLRFYEVTVEADGTFTMSNIAPGRYLILVRQMDEKNASDDKSPDVFRPLAWDDKARREMRSEAEAASLAIDLTPCRRVDNHVLRYTPPAKKPVQKKTTD